MDHSNYLTVVPQRMELMVGMMKIQLVVEECHSLVVAVVWLQAWVVGGIVILVVDDYFCHLCSGG